MSVFKYPRESVKENTKFLIFSHNLMIYTYEKRSHPCCKIPEEIHILREKGQMLMFSFFKTAK